MSNLYSKDVLNQIAADRIVPTQDWVMKHKLVHGADGTATDITNSTPLPVLNTGVDANGNVQNPKINESGSQYAILTSGSGTFNALVAPYGNLRVSTEGSTLFFDDFNAGFIDISNRWSQSASGGATISQANSILNLTTGVSANATAVLTSLPIFLRPGYGFLTFGCGMQFEAGTLVTNTHRFFGFGTPGANLSTTNPIFDGTGFEITPSGAFRAVVYSNNSAIFAQTLTPPTDGQLHSYYFEIRADAAYWYQNTFDEPVALAYYKNPTNTQLPVRISSLNGSSAPASTPALNCMALGVGDTSATNQKISDSLFPWRTAGVDLNRNLKTVASTDADNSGQAIHAFRVSQIQAQFDLSLATNDIASTVTGSGVISQTGGYASIATGSDVTASAKINTNKKNHYSPARGIFTNFSAAFTTPTSANSHQRVGYYDASNGLFVGFNGTTFGVTIRKAGVDTFIPQSTFNGDVLTGNQSATQFTKDGVAVAVNFNNFNLFRIRWGFFGIAPIKFEILNPDGAWIAFHTIRATNTSTTLNIENPNLPITAEVIKSSADATNLILKTSSWDAGTEEDSRAFGIEDVKSRKYITANLDSQTTTQTLYTVSSGRTLKVTTLYITVQNTSTTVVGSLKVADGTGGTIIIPLTVPVATNQATGSTVLSTTFPVPLRFSSSVYFEVIAGTLNYSAMIVGYEAEF